MAGKVCFICLQRFRSPVKSSRTGSSSCSRNSTPLYSKFVQFSRQYLQVSSIPVPDKDHSEDEQFCECCSESVASICQLYNELFELEHRLSSKLEELGSLMKESKKVDTASERKLKVIKILAKQLIASPPQRVSELRTEIVLKCFQKCESILKNGEHRKEFLQQNEVNNGMDVEIKVEPADELEQDESEFYENTENSSKEADKESSSEDDDDEKMSSSSDHTFAPSSGEESEHSDSGSEFEIPTSRKTRQIEKTPDINAEEGKPKRKPIARRTPKQKQPKPPQKRKKKPKIFPCKCKVCGIVIDGPMTSFRAHMKTHPEPVRTEPLVCETCGASFLHRRTFNYHINHSHGKHDCICDLCGKVLNCQYSLKKHQRNVHSNEGVKKFGCHLCPVRFKVRPSLIHHLLTKHGKEKGQEFTPGEGAKCKCLHFDCNSLFLDENQLKAHVEQEHPLPDTSWMCRLCGKVLVTKQRWTRHAEVHQKEKKYKCPVCNKSLSQPCAVKEHLMAVHGYGKESEYLPCPQPGCEWKYKAQSHLYLHLRKKHGISSGKSKKGQVTS